MGRLVEAEARNQSWAAMKRSRMLCKVWGGGGGGLQIVSDVSLAIYLDFLRLLFECLENPFKTAFKILAR